MMLDINVNSLREGFVRHFPIAAFVGAVILLEIILVIGAWHKLPTPEAATAFAAVPNTQALGLVLYTEYVYPFEIAAAILLVAMIAAIALTMRPHTRAKYQKPEEQVSVRREDRIKIVKMPSETKD
jgi:NADH-quinone oxidoreductase subunit J